MFDRYSKTVAELAKVIDSISNSNVDIGLKNDVLDFKASKAQLLRKELEKSYRSFLKFEKELKLLRFNEMVETIQNIRSAYDKKHFSALKTHIFNLQLLMPEYKEQKFSTDIRFPAEIKPELSADIQEIKKCFDAGCYRSAVVLCGRILETALHRKYYESTGKDILETNPAIGLGKLIAKLRELKVKFPPGITEQIHLINKVRISSVHKKKQVFIPSQHQANAIILYTLDILRQLF